MGSPTPTQIRDALGDYGVPVRLASGWASHGGGWPNGGLKAAVVHHTATPSATGSSGAPTLNWCLTAYSRPAANMLIGRGRNDVWLMNAAWTYHTGNGGPNRYGQAAGNVFHKIAWGIEIDDPGKKIGSLTDTQIEMTGRTLAAIAAVAPFGMDDIYTHTCHTNLCHGMGRPGVRAPYYKRKDDTLGDSGGKNGAYSATFWREQASKWKPGGTVPPVGAEGDDMPIIIVYGRSRYLLDGGRLSSGPLSDVTAKNLAAAGVKSVGVDSADWPDLAPFRAEWPAGKAAEE